VRAKFHGKNLERHGFIGGGLDIGKGFVWREVTLENGAFLDLRGSHIGGLCDDEKSWPIPGKLLIDGLTYGGFCGEIRAAPIEQTASPTDAASRLKWLRLQPRFYPQPYKQLANWMRENGDDTGATTVLAAKAEAQNSGEGAQLAPTLPSLGKRFPILIALALILATLLVTGSYFLTRTQKRAREAQPAAAPLAALLEIYKHYGAGQRGTRGESEMRAPQEFSRFEAGQQRTAALGESAEGPAIFKRTGEFWTLTYRGRSFQLKDTKGLAYIAFLLAHPGERFHVRELIARVEGVADPGSELAAEISRELRPTHELGDAGDALDPHAQADYRRRLRELEEDLAEAERLNDIGRAESIRREQDFLSAELSAAVGIGGQNRKAAAHVERARGVVSKNIRAGLEKIRSEDSTLGRYFATSIKTGYYCAYLPDSDRKISWQL
jgi:hypothetical protein